MDTLILNADYNPLSLIPISAISWKDAIKLMYLQHATVVEWHNNWTVNSPSTTFTVPSVMILAAYIKKKHHVKLTRSNLLLRDNFACQYCGSKLNNSELSIDHVMPKAVGGKTSWSNLTSACRNCNMVKGHKLHMKPYVAPVKPDYFQLLENARRINLTVPDEKWLPYLKWNTDAIQVVSPYQKKSIEI